MVIMTNKQFKKITDRIDYLETKMIGIELKQKEVLQAEKTLAQEKTSQQLYDEWMNGEKK